MSQALDTNLRKTRFSAGRASLVMSQLCGRLGGREAGLTAQ